MKRFAVLTITLAALAAPALASAGSLPAMPTEACGGATVVVRPTLISPSCDGTFVFGGVARDLYGRIHWRAWTSTSAVGKGAVWVGTCNPNCAEGAHVPHGATLHLFRPRVLHGQLVFSRLSYTARGMGPARFASATGPMAAGTLPTRRASTTPPLKWHLYRACPGLAGSI